MILAMIFAVCGLSYSLALFVRVWKYGIRDIRYGELVAALCMLILAWIFLESTT